MRFNLPKECKDKLHSLIDSLLSEDEVAETAALNYILSTIIAYRQKTEIDQDHATVSIAILWIFRLDRLTIHLLGSRDNMLDWQLGVLAAAMLRVQSELIRGKEYINILERNFKNVADDVERGHRAVTIAYLSFHFWKAQGHSAYWRPRPTIAPANATDGDEFIESAIRYAKIAYDSIPSTDKKRVYALNQFLYYLVERGAQDEVQAMEEAVTTLVPYGSFKHGHEFWQFRFDDTLARYYHLRAFLSADEQTWTQMMNIAESHLNKAIQEGWYDEEISNYQRELHAYRAVGFKKPSANAS